MCIVSNTNTYITNVDILIKKNWKCKHTAKIRVKVETIKIGEFEICGHIWPQSCLLHAKICLVLLQQTPFQLLLFW